MPLIGEVKAGGSTADELASTIAAELTPKYLNDPKVNIQVLGYRPFYIVGEVQKPGSYPYVDGMVVMNAVALAGRSEGRRVGKGGASTWRFRWSPYDEEKKNLIQDN